MTTPDEAVRQEIQARSPCNHSPDKCCAVCDQSELGKQIRAAVATTAFEPRADDAVRCERHRDDGVAAAECTVCFGLTQDKAMRGFIEACGFSAEEARVVNDMTRALSEQHQRERIAGHNEQTTTLSPAQQ